MTEQEAIEIIKTEKICVERNDAGINCDRNCGRCDLLMNSDKILVAYTMAISALEEIQQYRSLGTVEELREVREKQVPKKPVIKSDKFSDLIQHYYCPSCGSYFGQRGVHNVILFNKEKYCQGEKCGQAIDWSDTE